LDKVELDKIDKLLEFDELEPDELDDLDKLLELDKLSRRTVHCFYFLFRCVLQV
jgi:hypothetical protein